MGNCIYCGAKTFLFKKICNDCSKKIKEGPAKLENAIISCDICDSSEELVAIINDYHISEKSLKKIFKDVAKNTILTSIEDDENTKLVKCKIDTLVNIFNIKQADLEITLLSVFNDFIDILLDDSILAKEEEERFYSLIEVLGIDISHAHDKMPNFIRLEQAVLLRTIQDGTFKVSNNSSAVPFNLQKNEFLFYVFQNVSYLETKTYTKFEGGSSGVSFKVAKGVYIRTSAFKGHPVKYEQTNRIAVGILGFTQKHLYFGSQQKSFRVPYSKIVAFTQYSDGFGIQRDAQSAKPQTFITGDGWFVNNLIATITSRY
jgi:hypothetical protein